MYFLKTIEKGFSKPEIERVNQIIAATGDAYVAIYLNPNYKLKDVNIVMEINATLASIQTEQCEYASNDKYLKFFYQNSQKWLLLSHVVLRSATGLVTYKESLIRLMHSSSKTVHTYIAQALEKGLFINMPPSIDKIKDNKIFNIRPSVEVSIAFVEFNALAAKKNMDLILKFGDVQKITSSVKEKNITYHKKLEK